MVNQRNINILQREYNGKSKKYKYIIEIIQW